MTTARRPPRADEAAATNTGTKVEKIAVSLPQRVTAQARRAVQQGRATSVSAYLAAASDTVEREHALRGLLGDLTEQYGPPSAEDYAWADAALSPR